MEEVALSHLVDAGGRGFSMNSKKALKLLIIIHIFSLLPGCVSSTGRLGKPRYWIVKDGKPAAVVVIPQNASPVELFAAQELVHYVKESTGARLPMLTKAPARATSIIIGGPHRQTSATVLISRSSFRDLLPKPTKFFLQEGREGMPARNAARYMLYMHSLRRFLAASSRVSAVLVKISPITKM